MVIQYVMLNSEATQYVPGKWAVINSTLTGVNTGFAWIKRISHGVSTQQDLEDYIASYNNNDGRPDKSKLVGTLGEFQVAAISSISEYRRNSLRTENMPPSIYPIG